MSKRDVEVSDVYVAENIVSIAWQGNTGFGTYDLVFKDDKVYGYSECMDKGDDKGFLKEVLNALVEKVEIVE